MNQKTTLAAGAAVVLAYLALVLSTHELGVGGPARPGAPPPDDPAAAALAARHPFVLEDVYDRLAYQQRGRWIASGGRPYVDEFSEYPQLTTWLVALPYLFLDLEVERGEPFGSVHAARAALEQGGVPRELAAELVPLPQPGLRARSDAEVARALAAYPKLDRARARAAIEAADAAEARRKQELARNARAYGDAHHVLMALWFLALLWIVARNLRALGEPPGWALCLCLPASLYFGFNRFDLVVTVAVAAAIGLELRGRRVAAGAALGAAIMVKWAPLVLLPLFLSYNVHRLRAGRGGLSEGREERVPPLAWVPAIVRGALWPGLAACAVIALLLAVTFVWGGGGAEAVLAPFEWHARVRQPNHSSFLSLLTTPERWAWLPRESRPALERVFKALQLAPGFALALLPLSTPRALLKACLAATLFSVVFSEFFSPQWVLWITALGLYLAPRHKSVLALVVALEIAMVLQLPWFYYHMYATGDDRPFWTVTAVRMTLLLLFLALALGLALRAALPRQPPSESPA